MVFNFPFVRLLLEWVQVGSQNNFEVSSFILFQSSLIKNLNCVLIFPSSVPLVLWLSYRQWLMGKGVPIEIDKGESTGSDSPYSVSFKLSNRESRGY